MSESAPDLEQAEGTAEQGSSTHSLPAQTPVGPEGGVIDESEAIGTPADGPGAELLEPRDVTDEDPLVEGEVPEGLTRTEIEGDPQPSDLPADVGTPEPEPEPTPEELAALEAGKDESDDEEEFEPHELDLPPVPDAPASHAPFDPTEGHR